jgi:hypothetical protein
MVKIINNYEGNYRSRKHISMRHIELSQRIGLSRKTMLLRNAITLIITDTITEFGVVGVLGEIDPERLVMS